MAHIVGPDHPLYAVLAHPVFDLPHALTMVALGLWAGQQEERTGWAMLAAFVVAVGIGIALGRLETLPPWRPIMVFLTMTALGGLAAARLRAPRRAAAALAALAGVYQGTLGTLAHWQGGTGPYAVADMAVAAIVVPAAVLHLVRCIRIAWVQIAFRVLASWIAAAGIMLLALLLRMR